MEAAIVEKVNLGLYSLENNAPWHAVGVSGLCQIVSGPRFDSESFSPFLLDFVFDKGISIVIPNIDTATIALASMKSRLESEGVFAVVSELELCRKMFDKVEAEKFFHENKLCTPTGADMPLLAKPRFGASSRDHVLFNKTDEYRYWLRSNNLDGYLVQPFISGVEYSVDVYVSKTTIVQGAVSRVRVAVSGGEVMVTRTEYNKRVDELIRQLLAMPGWQGPLVIQVIDSGEKAYLIECNPRFGSGVTCSIEAGLDAPRWILREALGRPLPEEELKWKSGLCMTRCRKDYFIWLY